MSITRRFLFATLVVLGGLGALVILVYAVCSYDRYRDVRILNATVVRSEKQIEITLVTDHDLKALEGSKWAAVVILFFQTDQVQEPGPGREIVREFPGFTDAAIPMEWSTVPQGYQSKWIIHLYDPSTRQWHRLADGKEHILTFELYGGGYFTGGSLHSNRYSVRIPAR